jgi:predicted house-cleaning noncanonical NTP pyrophosphatase (MazG superfamily)
MTEREEFDKLVRDDIPDVIEANDETSHTHVATGEEYRQRLHEKLDEEIAELHEDPGAGELADVREVFDALREYYDIDEDAVAAQRREKADERGRFEDGVVLEAVER